MSDLTIDNLAGHAFVHVAAAPGRPTLLLLHGTGGDAPSFARFGRGLDPGAGLLAVQGNVREGGMARYFRRTAEGVYDMDDLARRTDDLARFLKEAGGRLGFEVSDLIGIGYSNGANILANLLFHHPRSVARAALLHPLIPFEPPPQPGLAGKDVLITGGMRDPIAPAPMTRKLADALKAQGARPVLASSPGGHMIEGDEIATVRQWLG